jgi:hypothetical protein
MAGKEKSGQKEEIADVGTRKTPAQPTHEEGGVSHRNHHVVDMAHDDQDGRKKREARDGTA